MNRILFFVTLNLFVVCNAFAQNVLPRNFQYAVKQQTRTLDGTPGTNYWQNTADYSINIKFNPKSRKLDGTETITYHNNSPDTLKMMVMSLYPNYYKRGVERNDNEEIDAKDLTNGVAITKFNIGDTEYAADAKLSDNLKGTWLYVNLHSPIPPRQTVSLSVDWNYVLNKKSNVRTGEIEPGVDFVAYCYPRVAVYDDVDGWNRNSYKGEQEFYNDFCNYDVTIQLPKGNLCWATGTNTNASVTLSKDMQVRLSQAAPGAPVTVYDPDNSSDAAALKQTHKKFKVVNWVFKATNVTDFTWACSNKYKWVATNALVDTPINRYPQINVVYNPKHKDYDSVVYYTKKTVELLSNTFPAVPYPYPHITVFDGHDQMEYPMMVNDNPLESREETIELVTHEVAHMYMPFITGCNETKYAWMDEGWATYCEHIFTHLIDSTLNDPYGLMRFRNFSGTEHNQPLSTISTQLEGESYFINAYAKPGTMMHALEQWLGKESFTSLEKNFIQTWQGKHPTQYDWMNYFIHHQPDSTGMQTFIDRWFYSFAYPDYKLSIKKSLTANPELTVQNVGKLPYPLIVEIIYPNKIVKRAWSTTYFKVTDDEAVFRIPVADVSPEHGIIRIYNPWVLDATPLDNEVTF